MKVIKRNGDEVVFDQHKIENAISQAFVDVDGEITDSARVIIDNVVKNITDDYECNDFVSVEEIQDKVEHYLMKSNRKDVAKSYIRYRYKKEVAREVKDDFISPIQEKLTAADVQNQNANVDEKSFGGRMGEAASCMTKQYAIDYLLSDMARENHLNNEIYIHDLDHYALGDHNCLTIPFDKLLAEGFNTRQTDVRPAGSVNTAMQLVAVIFQLQSLQQFGGVSAGHLDWTMVPYVRKSFYKHYKDGLKYIDSAAKGSEIKINLNSDEIKFIGIDNQEIYNHPMSYKYAMDMTEKEVHQAAEGLYHNLNTLQSRSGNQLPFTSINYGTCTLPEGRMVIRALLEVSIEGLGELHRTSIFPCGIFQYMKGVNDKPGTPNYDLYQLALQSTAKRLYPNYANVDWSGNAGYDRDDPSTYFSTMGKRKLSSCKIFLTTPVGVTQVANG